MFIDIEHGRCSPTAEIPGYGDKSAVTMCERLDIKSTKDTLKLKAAKDEVYLKGFYEGIMLVGECAGMKVKLSIICQPTEALHYASLQHELSSYNLL